MKKISVRLCDEDAAALAAAARGARVQTAVLARHLITKSVAAGNFPTLLPAPPRPVDLPKSVQTLVQILTKFAGNLTQISNHAVKLGLPFSGENVTSVLAKLTNQTRKLGLLAKAGQLNDGQAVAWLGKLAGPGDQLNGLAADLNAGGLGQPPRWHAVLTASRDALTGVET